MPRSITTRREFLRSTVAVAAAGAALPHWFSARAVAVEESGPKIKIFMHWDMEGVSGLFARQQAWYKDKEVKPEVAEEGIRLLIADVKPFIGQITDREVCHLLGCRSVDAVFFDPQGIERGRNR